MQRQAYIRVLGGRGVRLIHQRDGDSASAFRRILQGNDIGAFAGLRNGDADCPLGLQGRVVNRDDR